MKATEPKSIGEILNEFLDPAKLDDNINARRLEALWGEVVGPYINRQTVRRYVARRVLHVIIKSATLRNELMMNRSALVKRLNEATGADIIDDIAFS